MIAGKILITRSHKSFVDDDGDVDTEKNVKNLNFKRYLFTI